MGYPVQSAWIIHREEGAYSTGKYWGATPLATHRATGPHHREILNGECSMLSIQESMADTQRLACTLSGTLSVDTRRG